ncbi:hypothetical protein B0H14DRAFT_3465465 [Mycena olivaceomarginata]|nr:hypothetical protein B0H14DRAFT_3465465 [Mycena olivaceomarginata]
MRSRAADAPCGKRYSAAPAIVTSVKRGKRPRHRNGTPKARPGKLPWIHGTKRVFFESRKEEWLREAEANRSGSFYEKMAKKFVLKYGYHLADQKDLAEDVTDPKDEQVDEVVHEQLTAEEQQFRPKFMKALKTHIGAWYRTEHGGLLKSDKAAFQELFTGFYETRMKDHVEARWESLKRRQELSGAEMPKTVFKKECEVAMETEYPQALQAWETSLADSPTTTAGETAARSLSGSTIHMPTSGQGSSPMAENQQPLFLPSSDVSDDESPTEPILHHFLLRQSRHSRHNDFSDLPPTITTFKVEEISTPPSIFGKALGHFRENAAASWVERAVLGTPFFCLQSLCRFLCSARVVLPEVRGGLASSKTSSTRAAKPAPVASKPPARIRKPSGKAKNAKESHDSSDESEPELTMAAAQIKIDWDNERSEKLLALIMEHAPHQKSSVPSVRSQCFQVKLRLANSAREV